MKVLHKGICEEMILLAFSCVEVGEADISSILVELLEDSASPMNSLSGHSHGRNSANLGVWRPLSDKCPITPLEFFLEANFLKKLIFFL